MTMDFSLQLAGIQPMVFRAPIEMPVRTSFGTMYDRPMLLIRIEDASGAYGWGEVWCNFPSFGAEYRARLLSDIITPLALNESFSSPQEAFQSLEQACSILAIQSGEPGPLAQCLAGLDMAIWDMVARRNGESVGTLLGGPRAASVRCYASGINPAGAAETVQRARDAGFGAFKLKVGFGERTDLDNIEAIRAAMSGPESLMVDANQAWTAREALNALPALQAYAPSWLEEPLRADADTKDWQLLRDATSIPLAAGENIRGNAGFESALAGRYLGVVQPDIAKWGGFSHCRPLVDRIVDTGHLYCPHWLGGGIGLVASAHLLAASKGPGMLEVDVNDNPLRMALLPRPVLEGGILTLPDGAGLGVEPDMAVLSTYRVA